MTNHSENEVKVYAHIPDTTGSKYVIDENNERPSLPFNPDEHVTYEGTLDAISKKVIGSYVHIDKRLSVGAPDHIVYLTKPISETAINATYRWSIH